MKNKIYRLINDMKLSIITYRTYRSDMGCQVYEVYVTNGSDNVFYNDSYFVGCPGGKEYILESLKKELIELI